MGFLDRVLACRRHDPSRFLSFVVGGEDLGSVARAFAGALARPGGPFVVSAGAVSLREDLASEAERTAAVAEALGDLRRRGDLGPPRGEVYPVVREWGEAPRLLLDRADVSRFGVRAFGLHLNGLVGRPDGLHVWVARRSASVHTAPGKLDHLVAGGQPHGLGLRENLLKEASEEASVPPVLANRAVSVGTFSYRLDVPQGLRNDTLFLWDLVLPSDFVPRNRDGEVDLFELWPAGRVMDRVRTTEDFKFNVAPVLVDLFLRRGLLDPTTAEARDLVRALRG